MGHSIQFLVAYYYNIRAGAREVAVVHPYVTSSDVHRCSNIADIQLYHIQLVEVLADQTCLLAQHAPEDERGEDGVFGVFSTVVKM